MNNMHEPICNMTIDEFKAELSEELNRRDSLNALQRIATFVALTSTKTKVSKEVMTIVSEDLKLIKAVLEG